MKVLSLLFLSTIGLVVGQHEHSTSSAAASTASSVSDLPADFLVLPPIGDKPASRGGQITKQRIGPYTLGPGATVKGWFTPVASPCTLTGCYLTAYEASLEYENGTVANTNTGPWLHHMILNANGGNRLDITCPQYIPGIPRASRIFASGNERVTVRLDTKQPLGVYLKPWDTMDYILELMNEATETRVVYVTIKFEWTTDSSYKEAALIFLDAAGGCYFSEVAAKEGVYEVKTVPWRSTVSGNIIYGMGHVHDGGELVKIFRNGKEICSSEQLYGKSAGYISAGHGHEGHTEAPMTHISNSEICDNMGRIEKGDELYAISYYNTTKYPLMKHDGVAHSIMSIGVFWIARE